MKWTIRSHKLMHFNPRHKMMRFCHANSNGQSEQVQTDDIFKHYHRAVSHVMESLKKVLVALPKGGAVLPYKHHESQDDEFPFTRPDGIDYAAWDEYIDNCIARAKFEGKQKDVIADLTKIQKLKSKENFKLSIKHGIEILSVMPVSPHWDSMGILSINGNSAETVLHEMWKYKEPVYTLMIHYGESGSGEDTLSGKLLSRQVTMQVGYADLSIPDPVFTYTEPEDYFTFCYFPKSPEESDRYKVYGALFDQIEIATMKHNNTRSDETSFLMVYPITTPLGRRHYWHIHMLPDVSDATLHDLETAWRFVHQHINYSLLKTLVASELEQVDWSYAMSAMLNSKKDGSSEKLFASQSMMYLPIDSFRFDNDHWCYKQYDKLKLPGLMEWGECNCDDGQCFQDEIKLLHTNIGFVPDSSVWPGKIPEIAKIRYQHVIEQQLEATKQLLGFKDTERRRCEIIRQETINKITEKLCSAGIVIETISDDWKNTDLPCQLVVDGIKTFGKLACLIQDKQEDQLCDADLQAVLCFVQGGQHAQVSRIIEYHPVKGLTHSCEDVAQLKPLKKSIKALKHNVVSIKSIYDDQDWISLICEIAQINENALADLKNPIKNVDNLANYFRVKDNCCKTILTEIFGTNKANDNEYDNEYDNTVFDVRWNLKKELFVVILKNLYIKKSGWKAWSYCLSGRIKDKWIPQFKIYCIHTYSCTGKLHEKNGKVEIIQTLLDKYPKLGITIWYVHQGDLYRHGNKTDAVYPKPAWANPIDDDGLLLTYNGWYTPN